MDFRSVLSSMRKPCLGWLLIFVPVAVICEYLFHSPIMTFFSAALAIIPLAGLLGKATEHLAVKVGDGIGALLNATFGNAAELIIALSAIHAGLYDVVKASITGSIIGNLLLVLGLSLLVGGIKYPRLEFNSTAAKAQISTLIIALIGLILPAAFNMLSNNSQVSAGSLSVEMSALMIFGYFLILLFSLRTNKKDFNGEPEDDDKASAMHSWSVTKSIVVLAISTVFIAWMREILVGAIEPAAESLGMSSIFVGIFVVAIVGNAAEHTTAIMAAIKGKGRVDLSYGIAVGSSIQVALLVAPLLVFASYVIGPTPMNLVFTNYELLAIGGAVIIVWSTTDDGESNWLEGSQLLMVYAMLLIVCHYL